jgi:glycosyltransferase involved in cell wall biosynthesis
MPKISVIIPIYNIEAYLAECLNSVRNQTFADFEVLMIDDCSTDGSPKIIDEFAKLDSRFLAVHKPKNEGTFLARKTALEVAKGTYIASLDSDDYYKPDFLEKMHAKIIEKNYDMVLCLYERTPKSPVKDFSLENFSLGKDKSINIKNMLDSKITPFTWDKLIKRDIYREVIFYDIHLCAYEDVLQMFQIIFLIKDFAFVNESLYVHRMHADSFSAKIKMQDEVSYHMYLVITMNRLFGEVPAELMSHARNSIDVLRRANVLPSNSYHSNNNPSA